LLLLSLFPNSRARRAASRSAVTGLPCVDDLGALRHAPFLWDRLAGTLRGKRFSIAFARAASAMMHFANNSFASAAVPHLKSRTPYHRPL
jgi:hypothetical protein